MSGKKPDGIPDDVKQKILDEYMQSSAGRQKLAASMAAPLRTRRDYTSVGRKIFMVEQLGFHCDKCGFMYEDKDYVHSEDECVVAEVLLT